MVVVVGVLNTQPQSVNRGSRRQPIQAILGFHLDEGSASLLVSAQATMKWSWTLSTKYSPGLAAAISFMR